MSFGRRDRRASTGSAPRGDRRQRSNRRPVHERLSSRIPGAVGSSRALREAASWLAGTRLGLAVMALVVGAFAGLAAALFRWLIYAFTWLATGHQQFGQQGHAASLHMPWLGLCVPGAHPGAWRPALWAVDRPVRARGARPRGPEVMLAVAENGGRIRPPVTIVKALASAICIGTGGSVGREGPIVQVGSALASTVGSAGADVREPASDHRRLRCRGRDRGHVQRSDHRAVLRVRDRPARVLAGRAVRHQPRGRHRRRGQPRVLRLGAVLHRDPAWPDGRRRLHLPADRRARDRRRADRRGVQDLPVQARGRRRRAVEGPSRVGASRGRRPVARRAAAGAAADVRRRLSGDGPGGGRPLPACGSSSC